MSPSLVLRKLEAGDYHKGYLQLLSQLTTVGEVTEEQFSARLAEMRAVERGYIVMVFEDTDKGAVVGSATCAIERKFIHACGMVGHIEDVVVDGSYRGQRLGQRLVDALIEASKSAGCYKVILDCSEAKTPFYEKCGLVKKEVQMVRYLDR
ncbi:hypothetical protein FOA52_001275 [Chlamydomonas sp. UWO 241]|nr:hypothetical protein FOA52_001275 [Chlamydomonas sp. UWO 241]